jgi:DNA polymerase III alpha subunit/intein/homing endonuclease
MAQDIDTEDYFEYRCRKGLEERGRGSDEVYVKRLEYEMGVIKQMGFCGYFLVVSDFITWGKKNDILIGGGRGCLRGDTRIHTPRGLVPIRDLRRGDMVFDGEGHIAPVADFLEYDCEEELVEIKTFYGGDPVVVTGDHEILVARNIPETDHQKLARGYKFNGKQVPVWVKAQDVLVGDLMVTPKVVRPVTMTTWEIEQPIYSRHRNTSGVKTLARAIGVSAHALRAFNKPRGLGRDARDQIERYLEANNLTELSLPVPNLVSVIPSSYVLDFNLGKMFGLWISDGWLTRGKTSEIGFCCKKSEDDGTIPALLKNIFHITPTSYDHATKNLRQFSVLHRGLSEAFSQLFPDYRYSSGTKYIPDCLMQTPEEFRLGLLEGLWAGDGSFKGKTKYASVSPRLAVGVFSLLTSLGMHAGIRGSTRQERRSTRRNYDWTEYSVMSAPHFHNVKVATGYAYDGQYLYSRVRQVSRVPGDGKVYDLTIPTTHSYLTDCGVVHNSASGSLCSYSLKITNVDPIEYGLLFERFLNPGRTGSPPDIDVDFEKDKRDLVIDYVRQKYGSDQVSQIGTIGTMKAKQAIQKVCSALGYDKEVGEKLRKLCLPPVHGKPQSLAKSIEDVKELNAFVRNQNSAEGQILNWARRFEDRVASVGVHASGIVISPTPICSKIPLYQAKNANATTQWDMGTVEEAGFIKFDFLGLMTLSKVRTCLDMIQERYGSRIELDAIPLDDEATFKFLQQGELSSIFQLETSSGMKDLVIKVRPEKLEDLAAIVAIYRPGPLQSNGLKDYLAWRAGAPAKYLVQELGKILQETGGFCVYQDEPVNTPSGFTKIKDLKAGDLILNGEGRVDAVKTVQRTGEKEVYEYITDGLTAIRCTPEHRVSTIMGDVPIHTASHVLRRRFTTNQASINVAYDKLWLLGLAVADGCLGASSPSFTVGYQSRIPVLADTLTSQFQRRTHCYFNTRAWYVSVLKNDDEQLNPFNSFLKEWGLMGKVKNDKVIPARLLHADNTEIAAFLAGIFDGDGMINSEAISFCSTCPENMLTVQRMLDLLHITFYRVDLYHLQIRDRDLFMDTVGRFLKFKAGIKPAHSVCTNITVSAAYFNSLVDKHRRGTAIKPFLRSRGIVDNAYWTRHDKTLRMILHHFPEEAESLVSTYIRGEYAVEQLRERISIGTHPVYDLETESDNHHFLVNHIVVHNCVYQEQIIRIAQELAGYTLSEADLLRKAMGKKKLDVLLKEKAKFRAGWLAHNLPEDKFDVLWEQLQGFADYAFNKCLSGDTVVERGITNQHYRPLTIEHLYKTRYDNEYVRSNGLKPLHNKLRTYGFGKILAFDKDGKIRPRPIKDIYYNGPKETYTVTFSDGSTVRATKDHKFLGPDGFIKVEDFILDSTVIFKNGGYSKSPKKSHPLQGKFSDKNKEWKKRSYPNGRTEGFQKGEDNPAYTGGQYLRFEQIRKEREALGHCETCLKPSERYELHHIDADRLNNSSENLVQLCPSCHKIADYKLGRTKQWEKGHTAEVVTVSSVTYYGVEDTYDIEMDTEEHNFIANGIVTSNSHAVSYALLTYQTAWLKTHYPIEFITACMVRDCNDSNQMVKYIGECRRMGVKILPPSVNRSRENFSIEPDGIRFGLVPIKGIGEAPAEEILKERTSHGEFKDLPDFCRRVILVPGTTSNAKTIEVLIRSGAFDDFGVSRASMLAWTDSFAAWRVENKAYQSKVKTFEKKQTKYQERLEQIRLENKKLKPLKEPTLPEAPEMPKMPVVEELSDASLTEDEHSLLGIFITGHPLKDFDTKDSIELIKELPSGSQVQLLSIVAALKEHTIAKNRKKMAFCVLEDLSGQIEAVIFPRIYEKFSHLLNKPLTPIAIEGTTEVTETENGENAVKLVITSIATVSHSQENKRKLYDLSVDAINCASIAPLLSPVRESRQALLEVTFKSGLIARIKMPLNLKDESVIPHTLLKA